MQSKKEKHYTKSLNDYGVTISRDEKIDSVKREMKKQAVAHMWFSSKHNRELIQKNCNLTDPTTNRYIAVLVGAGFIVENEHGRGFYNLTEETK